MFNPSNIDNIINFKIFNMKKLYEYNSFAYNIIRFTPYGNHWCNRHTFEIKDDACIACNMLCALKSKIHVESDASSSLSKSQLTKELDELLWTIVGSTTNISLVSAK
jgi:hypothetical protein